MNTYIDLAQQKPLETRLGGAFITMVQVHKGSEETYNRWYEDDHFIPGAMIGPWIFAGRRFCRMGLQRFSSKADDSVELGSFITVYFALDGHVGDAHTWINAMWHVLEDAGRGPRNRTHVYTDMHDLLFSHVFDPAPMAPIHALDYPYRGLAVEVVEANDHDSRDRLIDWMRDEFVPSQAGATGQCLAFVPRTQPADGGDIPGAQDARRNLQICLLWLFREEPADLWPGHFQGHVDAVNATGHGEVRLIAPFEPTLPGTATKLA